MKAERDRLLKNQPKMDGLKEQNNELQILNDKYIKTNEKLKESISSLKQDIQKLNNEKEEQIRLNKKLQDEIAKFNEKHRKDMLQKQ